jgi:hypothetical protein
LLLFLIIFSFKHRRKNTVPFYERKIIKHTVPKFDASYLFIFLKEKNTKTVTATDELKSFNCIRVTLQYLDAFPLAEVESL